MTRKPGDDAPIVVGVGASAGGLEAFQQLLTGLPDTHNLVIVLVQHLDPEHESLMPELIAARTASPVHSVTDGMQVEPGHVYLIPPGYEMEIAGDRLTLTPFTAPRGTRRPIDRFFESLAASHGESAIAVVLSGTGSDGATGAGEVKGQGGLVFVQDPGQAKYDGMPKSVLAGSGADVVLRAEEIVDVIRDYFDLRSGIGHELQSDDAFLDRVMRHVRFRTGHDFSDYKPATMQRRLAVRMSVLNISEPGDYLKYMAETKSEADILFRDLLINVTGFFRDADHFETLRDHAIPQIVGNVEQDGDVRVWVAGCSTGEEAYSIAMLVAEEIVRVDKRCGVIVFATDIDEDALARARKGVYQDAVADAIPQNLLDRYFRKVPGGYEVGKHLREMIRISRHSFVKDPPFSRLDLICCRNVMIYFNDSLQDRACKVFHYGLRGGGYLFIGPSENPKAIRAGFEEVSARARLFKRRPGPSEPLNLGAMTGSLVSRGALPASDPSEGLPVSEVEQVLLAEFAPAYLHVAHDNAVLYASENAARYLAVRSGRFSSDLFNVVAPELESLFRRVSRVETQAGATLARDFQGSVRGEDMRMIVTARRLADGTVIYVIADRLQLRQRADAMPADQSAQQERYIRELEGDLDEAKQTVRTTVEELETSNEELKSSNEEMMSMNEELQSGNEELTTINDELQEKVRALHQANVDMGNFVRSTRVATVFLGDDLTLRSFTPEAEQYFRFTDVDIGRPMDSFASELDERDLYAQCAQTLEDREERTIELPSVDQSRSFVIQIMPYSLSGNEDVGVVFTVIEVTELRTAVDTAEAATRDARRSADEVEQIYANSPLAMGLLSRDYRYIRLNKQLAAINGKPVEDHIGRKLSEIVPDVAEHTERMVRQVFETGEAIRDERIIGVTDGAPDSQRIWDSDWTPFHDGGEMAGVAVTVRDVTDIVHTNEKLRQLMQELEHRVKNMLANVMALVNQARRETSGDTAAFETLAKRIGGLANTHALLTAEHWSSADIMNIIEPETVALYGEDRVILQGPRLRLNAEAALSLGMAVHELATNAAKYGAFSLPDGTVTITWSRVNDQDGDQLFLRWSEAGGPPVSTPDHQGFGSKLVTSTIQHALGGKIEKTWEPSGLTVVFSLDFGKVTAS